MMMSQTIIYHMESIQEMQIMCNLSVYLLQRFLMKSDDDEGSGGGGNELIINILLTEHIFSYLSDLFRKWEIARCGRTDVNGIMRAPKEAFLATVQIFVDCILFGWTIYHLYLQSRSGVLH